MVILNFQEIMFMSRDQFTNEIKLDVVHHNEEVFSEAVHYNIHSIIEGLI